LLKILPSYFCSFLGHAVLIAGLSIAASMALRGERIALDGGVVTIGPAEQLEPLDVALDLGAPPSEMQQLQEREQDSAATLADAIAPSGMYAGKDLLEDWGEEEDESELDALVTAGLEESLGSNQPVDKTKGDARFFGVHASGRKFVFIIDCSGSMRGLRWNLAKAELKNSIRNLDEQKEFLVILYNDRTWAMFNRDLEKAELVAATTDSKRRFFQWLSRQEPQGWTRPRLALQLALGQEPDAIFLLSDGELQDDSQHFLLTANQAREMEDGSKRQTPVHTVALDLSVGAGLLEQIAGQNSGVFTHITTAGPPRR
jgi:Mg-chelatase subunit ChlD